MNKAVICLAMAVVLAVTTRVPAREVRYVQMGSLTCGAAPHIGVVHGASQQIVCTLQTKQPEQRELYKGTIVRIRSDADPILGGKMLWGVYGTTEGLSPHRLAGTYRSRKPSTEGAGGLALVGGKKGAIRLRPISVREPRETNLAWAVMELTLE